MRQRGMQLTLCFTIYTFALLESVFCGKTFTIHELLTTKFSRKVSDDLYLDPCKSEKFYGDIALTRSDYLAIPLRRNNVASVTRYDSEMRESNMVTKNMKRKKKFGRKRKSRRRHRHLYNKRRKTRAATARTERLWDNAIIPYEIDANFSGEHRALFRQAMRHWENYTCVKFLERSPNHTNFIVFTERPCGCCSYVGKRGDGAQAISIGKNCDKFGIVVHELGHVVGFWHEHTRPDRDDHVKIVTKNIMQGQEYNFNKLTGEEVNSLDLPYDYDSIMHYARNTFSKSTYLDTILPQGDPTISKLPEIGQRVRLSKGDIAQTNRLYNCPACGRTIQEPSGTISSTDYPFHGLPSEEQMCEWRITGTHGERIAVDITELDIYNSDDCETDYLEIKDGYTQNSQILGRFCGSGKVPEKIITSGHRMIITYRTAINHLNHKGFKAKFEALCGGEVVREEGVLQSPNYPEDYHASKECVWKITVPANYQVSLRFQSFQIENHDNCVYDYLEIRDGHESTSDLLGKLCGHKTPDEIRSTSNKMYVKFVSDSSVQKPGFSAVFVKEYDECKGSNHGCEQQCVNTVGGYRCDCDIGFELHSDGKTCEDACGGVIAAVNGTIISPSFPELYPPNKNCVWEIIAPPQYRITMNFTHFDLEGNNHDCEYDSVDVRSKLGDIEVRKHGVFCGAHLPPVITSDGNSLRVEFNSDNSVQKSGFAAVFFTDKDECANENGGCQHICKNTIGSYYCACHNGFVLHENKHQCKEGSCIHHISSPVGDIVSPNFPDFYPSKKDCAWLFTTTPGHRIKLVFNEFELEPHQECAYDHIAVYDGDTSDNHILGRFCGSKVPHPLIASGNRMYLVFKSDSSVQRKGFKARHSTACGGRLVPHSTLEHLYSHAKYGDQNYENKEDCDWIIKTRDSQHIQLRFLTFELEHEQDCSYDYVDIYNGYDDSSPLLGRFCGNKVPPEIISSSDSLLVRFRSDDTINNKGFSAAYIAIDGDEDYPKSPKH